MSETSHIVLTDFETSRAGAAEPGWLMPEVKVEEVEVRCRRILLVEDEEMVRSCLRMMLEFAGHQVTEASNAAEGLNLFIPGQFYLVITDFEMPVMRGSQFAARIKLLAPSMPILMITASESARRGPANPVDALLNKPFTGTELHSALDDLLFAGTERNQAIVGRELCREPATRELVCSPG